MASFISVITVGAIAIQINALTVLIMIPYGFSIASSVLVGKSMGEGSGKRALSYANITVGMAFIASVIISVSWYQMRDKVAYFFTDQEELIEIISDNTLYCCIYYVIHGTGLALSGALRGMGR